MRPRIGASLAWALLSAALLGALGPTHAGAGRADPSRAAEAEPLHLDLLSRTTSGGMLNVVAVGELVVASVYDELWLIETTDGGLRPAGELEVGDRVADMVVGSGNAYLATGAGGITVVDLGDARSPRVLAVLPSVNAGAAVDGIALEGTSLYAWESGSIQATVEPGALQVIDVADAGMPSRLGSVSIPLSSQVWDLDAHGGFVYLTTHPEIVIVDARDPAAPREVGRVPASGHRNWQGMDILGPFAYVGAQTAGLVTFDLTDPGRPVERSVVPLAGALREPRYRDGRLHVPSSTGLHILGLQDPSSPLPIASADLPGDAAQVDVRSGRAYVAVPDLGLFVVGVTDASAPAVVGSLTGPSPAVAIHLRGETAFVLTSRGELFAFDIRDPREPRQIGHVSIRGNALDMRVVGDAALVTVGGAEAELVPVNIADPREPEAWTGIPMRFVSRGMAVCEDTLFVGAEKYIAIVGVDDPLQPRMLATYDEPRIDVRALACDADHVFAAGTVGASAGVIAFRNLSERLDVLSRVGFIQNTDIRHLGLIGHQLVAGGRYGVSMLDVRDPSFMREVDLTSLPIGPQTVSLAQVESGRVWLIAGLDTHRLWLAEPGPAGLSVLMAPVEVGLQHGLSVSGDVVGMANGTGGMLLYRLSGDGAVPPPTPSPTEAPTPTATRAPPPVRLYLPLGSKRF